MPIWETHNNSRQQTWLSRVFSAVGLVLVLLLHDSGPGDANTNARCRSGERATVSAAGRRGRAGCRRRVDVAAASEGA